MMSNAEHLIENLILGMKDGKMPMDILEESGNLMMLEDEFTGITSDEAIAIACHVVYGLYDGKFPKDILAPGDEVIDTAGNLCVVTCVHSRAVHVLYPNGKTHKFPATARFRLTGRGYMGLLSLLDQLNESKERMSAVEDDS